MIYKKPVNGRYWVAGRGVMGGLFKGMKTINPNKGTASTINEKNEDEAEYNNKFDNTAPTGYRFTSKKLTAEAKARLKGYWLQCANVNDKKLELKSDNKTWDEWLAKYKGAVQNCLYYLANNKFITQKNIDEMSNIIGYDDFINESTERKYTSREKSQLIDNWDLFFKEMNIADDKEAISKVVKSFDKLDGDDYDGTMTEILSDSLDSANVMFNYEKLQRFVNKLIGHY